MGRGGRACCRPPLAPAPLPKEQRGQLPGTSAFLLELALNRRAQWRPGDRAAQRAAHDRIRPRAIGHGTWGSGPPTLPQSRIRSRREGLFDPAGDFCFGSTSSRSGSRSVGARSATNQKRTRSCRRFVWKGAECSCAWGRLSPASACTRTSRNSVSGSTLDGDREREQILDVAVFFCSENGACTGRGCGGSRGRDLM